MAESRTVEGTVVAAPLERARQRAGDAVAERSGQSASGVYLAAKRIGDVLLAAVAIVLCAPLWLVCAIAIKLDSRGPILFRQVRPGHGGVPFHILKFRTMCEDAEERLVEVLDRNKEPDHSLIRVDDDPRVTRVGHLLRKWSIDETPQFINVLKGEMSIVGPRPISRPISDPRGTLRLEALPGITGPWQTNGRKLTSCDHMLELDMKYLQERSVWLDLRIMLRTVAVVFRGDGAE